MLKSFAVTLLGIGMFVGVAHAQGTGTHMHIRSHTHMHTHMNMYPRMHSHQHMLIHPNVYMHPHVHMHPHTYVRPPIHRRVIPGCGLGQPAAATCACGTAANRPLLCHKGQWCHPSQTCTSWSGTMLPHDKAPDRDTLNIYGASDYAVTDNGGDYTVHLIVGVDPQNRIYLLDVWRRQTSPDRWIGAFCDLALKWKPLQWAEEQGQISAGVGPFLDQPTRERQAYVYREQFPTRGDKARRAQSIRGRMALDGLYVPERAPWYANFRAELLSFPAGKHDDQVDALGLIGQLLNKMVVGRPVVKPKETQQVGYAAYRSDSGDDHNPDLWGL